MRITNCYLCDKRSAIFYRAASTWRGWAIPILLRWLLKRLLLLLLKQDFVVLDGNDRWVTYFTHGTLWLECRCFVFVIRGNGSWVEIVAESGGTGRGHIGMVRCGEFTSWSCWVVDVMTSTERQHKGKFRQKFKIKYFSKPSTLEACVTHMQPKIMLFTS